jgi:hypothetical protein
LIGARPALFKQYVNDLFFALGGDFGKPSQVADLKLIEGMADDLGEDMTEILKTLDPIAANGFARMVDPYGVLTNVTNQVNRKVMKVRLTANTENDKVRQFAVDKFEYVWDRVEPSTGKPSTDSKRELPTTRQVLELYKPLRSFFGY